MTDSTSQLRPDGTIFPPVTPDPPNPPGYEAPRMPEPFVDDDGDGNGADVEPPD
jgi:hypothetical protein